MITFIYAGIAGILFGIFTGLIPGVHINLIASILTTFSLLLIPHFGVLPLSSFIIAMSVTHSFVDPIPSVFLGVPDADMVMGILPGHRMLLEGKGIQAIQLTVVGSLLSLILVILLIFLVLPFLQLLVDFISPKIGWILLFVVLFMVLKGGFSKIYLNVAVFLLAGTLGIVVFRLNLSNPLLPMLSGLFGVSGLLLSLQSVGEIPKQDFKGSVDIGGWNMTRALSGAVIAGSITGLFPGLGAAHAAVIAMQFVGRIGSHAFLVLIGGISTVNFIFSLATFYAIEKARNGSIIAVQGLLGTISSIELWLLVFVALFAGGVASFIALFCARKMSWIVERVSYRLLCFSVLLLVTVLVYVFSGWIGLLVLLISTFVGMIPQLLNINRSHLMGCLLLPVILFFLL